MSYKSIEKRIENAFSKTVPDVLESVRERCGEQYIPETNVKRAKKRLSTSFKIVAVAAALIVLLTGTVTAINMTGLITDYDAIGYAMTYAVNHADTEQEGTDLGNYILSGLCYDTTSTEQTLTVGLFGLRSVYNVCFRATGYVYNISVDAKTGVVLSCEKDVDPDWEQHLETPADTPVSDGGDRFIMLKEGENQNFAAVEGDIDDNGAFMIAEDIFGLDLAGRYYGCGDGITAECAADRSNDTLQYLIWQRHGGYVYEARIDSVTGEVIESYVTPDPKFEGERHLHTKREEFIGTFAAYNIAKETAKSVFGEDGVGFISYCTTFLADDNHNGLAGDYYSVTAWSADENRVLSIKIDARTGEVLEAVEQDVAGKNTSNEEKMPMTVPSAEAPEGMISEAQAQMTALEDAGVNVMDLIGFTVELDGGVYNIRFTVIGGREYNYRVGASDGEILSDS